MNGPSRGHFEKIFRDGKRERGTYVRIHALPGGGVVGFATSKAIGCNARRNRQRRRLRAAWDALNLDALKTLDWVVIASREAADAGFPELSDDLRAACTRLLARWEGA